MSKKSNLRYWLTLVACCGITTSSIGIMANSVGVFFTPVSEALGVGRGAFALNATLAMLGTGFFSPIVAKLMRKMPIRPLLLFGILLAAGSTACMAFSRSLFLFYILGLLRGIGVAFFSIMPITTIIGNWFEKSHGLAVGIALSFSGVGGALFNPLLTAVIKSFGWEKAFLFMAASGLILALPGALYIRFRPEDLSMPPYGGVMAPPPEPGAQPQAAKKNKLGRDFLLLLVLMSSMALMHNAIAGIGQHFPGIAEWLGTGAAVGATMVSAGMIGNIVTKLVLGVLSDRIGPFPASITMISVNAAALLTMLSFGGTPAVALAAAFFYGAAYSVGAVGLPLLTRRLFGVENYSSAYSTITLFGSLGNAFSLTLVGLVYDLTGGYHLALICGMVIDCINICLLVLMPRIKKRIH